MMKKSSINTAPNGKMPPTKMHNTGCMYLFGSVVKEGMIAIKNNNILI
jgi:hypothetical protein